MPNWCENTLDVKGHPARVVDFIEYAFRKSIDEYTEHLFGKDVYTLDFEKILPTPIDEKGKLIEDWYDWRLNNWGTKWNAVVFSQTFNAKFKEGPTLMVRDEKITLDYLKEIVNDLDVNYETSISIGFNTAWSYPMHLYNRVVEDFEGTELEFEYTYYEGGCGFAGEATWRDGVCVNNEEYDCIDPYPYYKYILSEGLESFEYMMEILWSSLDEYFGHLGSDVVTDIYETIDARLIELKENKIDAFVRMYVRLLGIVVEKLPDKYPNIDELVKKKRKEISKIG